jgi:hypothetical protein
MMKTWEAPKLIVLVRSRPEEMILQSCKTCHIMAGPGNFFDGCEIAVPEICPPCEVYGSS